MPRARRQTTANNNNKSNTCQAPNLPSKSRHAIRQSGKQYAPRAYSRSVFANNCSWRHQKQHSASSNYHLRESRCLSPLRLDIHISNTPFFHWPDESSGLRPLTHSMQRQLKRKTTVQARAFAELDFVDVPQTQRVSVTSALLYPSSVEADYEMVDSTTLPPPSTNIDSQTSSDCIIL